MAIPFNQRPQVHTPQKDKLTTIGAQIHKQTIKDKSLFYKRIKKKKKKKKAKQQKVLLLK